MSEVAARALTLIALAILLTQVSVIELAKGKCRSLLSWEDPIRREHAPTNFWIAWSLWAALSLGLGAGSVHLAFQAFAVRNTAPPLADGGWWWLVTFLVLCMFLAWSWGRGGLPVSQFRRGRARWHQAQRIRALTDDRETEIEDLGFDDFVDLADMDWLEEVEQRLAAQSPPRNLAAAIDATESPPDGRAADTDRRSDTNSP